MRKKILVLDEDCGRQVVGSLERIATGPIAIVRYAAHPGFDQQSRDLLEQGEWFLIFVGDNTFTEFKETAHPMLINALSSDPNARVVIMRTGPGKRPDLEELPTDRLEFVNRDHLIADASTYLRTPPL